MMVPLCSSKCEVWALMKRMRRTLGPFAALLILLGSLALGAATQNAVVIGFVLDQTGAPVPGATVRLFNAGTGFSREQTTDAYGSYTFGNVPPAPNYTLVVEKAGFATGIRSGVSVAVGASKQVVPAFFLQPAAAAAAPPEQQEQEESTVSPELVSNTLGGVVTGPSVRTLPLPNRDFLDLALLIPGTYPVEQGSALEGASLVVNGVRADMNNFLLDGADNNDYTNNQSLPFQLVEALQEFRVQASTSNPEFGRNTGAQINSVSRSGANEWHGTVFWFNRVDRLAASNPLSSYEGGTFDAFNNAARVTRVDDDPTNDFFPTPVLDDPVLRSLFDGGRESGYTSNQFGANVGGPIAKDKAFFFFNWESFRSDNDRPVFERVPDNNSRAFAGGTPSTDRVATLLDLYPAPNVPESTVTDAFGFPVSDPDNGDLLLNGAFFSGDSANFTETDNFLGRVDVQPTENVNLSFKYNIQIIDLLQAGAVSGSSDYGGSGLDLDGRNQNFSFNYLHQLSVNWLNEFRAGWNRFRLDSLPQDRGGSPSSTFDNLNFTEKGFPSVLIGGFDFTFGPYAQLGASFSAPSNRANNLGSLADNVSLVWGRHVLKAGADYRYNRLNVTNEALGRGFVTFFSVPFGAFTGAPDLASIARVSPEFGGGFDRRFSAHSLQWFVQDTWRPRSNVSLTYGLRHEINQAPREARDRLVNHYPGACSEFACLIRSGTSEILGTDGTSLGTASFTAPRAGFDTDYNNFAPFVGLAWDPWSNGKTVFRGAYRVTFDQQSLQPSINMLHNPPFVQQWVSFFAAFGASPCFSILCLGDVYPPGFPDVDFDSFDLDGDGFESLWFRQPYSITSRDPDTRTSYIQQFNLGVQQQVGSRSLFEVSYVASLGRKLPRPRLLLGCTQSDFVGDPFACLPPVLGGTGTASDSIVNQENSANSSYHSLQLGWETRQLKGLTVRLLYQWAHAIDDASSSNAPVFFFSPASAALLADFFSINKDQFAALNSVSPTLNLRPGFPVITTRPLLPSDTENSATLDERASSDFDIRHRLSIDYIYDIPRFAPVIGEGWQLAGITTVQSGQPFTVYIDFFGIPLRPTFRRDPTLDLDNADGAIDNGAVMGSTDSSFGTSAAEEGRAGGTPRNAFEGPDLVNFDFSVLKNTYLGESERVNLQFRVEFFNLFNTANFRLPYTRGGAASRDNVGGGVFVGSFTPDPFYGLILQARPGREVQFGLKVIF